VPNGAGLTSLGVDASSSASCSGGLPVGNAENGSCAMLKAANRPMNKVMPQTTASNEADIATIINRTLGNIPPRSTPVR
jgi:hypothetical protein